jgi:3-oxoadipate enol-lactonase
MPFAKLGPIRIHYEISGAGEPLVLIAGWTLNTRFWDGVTAELAKSLQVLPYDVRGTGQSTSDPAFEYSRVADAEDLMGLLGHLNLGKVHLVGHSKGARVALIFAMLHPERVHSVTAIGSAEPHGAAVDQRSFRPFAQAWVERARDIAQSQGAAAAITYLSHGRLFRKLRTTVDGVRRLHLAMEGYQGADLLSEHPQTEVDTESLCENLTMPVQFLIGDADPFFPECEYAHRRISGSELVIFKDSGHMVPLEQPDRVAIRILQFLASLSKSDNPHCGPSF